MKSKKSKAVKILPKKLPVSQRLQAGESFRAALEAEDQQKYVYVEDEAESDP